MVSVCDLECVRVVCRRGRRQVLAYVLDLLLVDPAQSQVDVVQGFAIVADVLLLDQLYLGLCDRHRGSSCLSFRHTGLNAVGEEEIVKT
jgi:hypothetical protein